MDDTRTLLQQGKAQAARRDWPAAIASFRELTIRQPGEAIGWIALAQAHGFADQPREEREATLAALALAPRDWPLVLALARLLLGQADVRALEALAASMRDQADSAPPAVVLDLAQLLGHADAHGPALAWLEDLIRRHPGQPPAYYLRGLTRLFLGELEAARDDLEKAVALAPAFAQAHWRLAELRGLDRGSAPGRVLRLKTERGRVPPGGDQDVHLSFALYAELEALGRHDEAWDALERGCRGKRASLRYDAASDQRLFQALAARCDDGFLAGPGLADEAGPAPVFIVGLFRSGTTLLERILAGHPQVADGGESLGFSAALREATNHRSADVLDETTLARLDGVDFAALGAAFQAGSSWRARGRALWTEKLPSNFLLAGLIARALPRARFIHMRRAPMDVCFANLRQLYGPFAPYSYDQAELAAYHRGYEGLMAHWRALLGGRLLEVDHAALVSDPEAQARRVLAFCGLDYDPRVLDIGARRGAVSTASAAQVREGIRAPAGEPAWWPYRERLAVLAEGLGEISSR